VDSRVDRRAFLTYGAAATAAAAATLAAGCATHGAALKVSPGRRSKAVQLGMLPKDLPNEEKFALAKACGFQGMEAYPMGDLEAARQLGEQARQAGVPIHSICAGGWKTPFSDPDPAVIEQGHQAMETALRSAKAMGANAVLLVPAVVNAKVRYCAAYERSQANIRPLLPLAEELGVVIAVENVWNNFLLSPIEFARYVDEFRSPWLRAYFDVGNVVKFGWPQDWIRTLGHRIVKVHLKDYSRKEHRFTPLGEGDVDWAEVTRAFDEIGYQGYMTTELAGGDEAYLRGLSETIKALTGV